MHIGRKAFYKSGAQSKCRQTGRPGKHVITDITKIPDVLIPEDLEAGDDEDIWNISSILEKVEDWQFIE